MKGPFTRLGQPPRSKGGSIDPFELAKWFDRLWLILSGIPGIAWDIIDKAGSKLSDIETRWHSMLQKVYGADVTDTSQTIEDAAHVKHVSDAQAKKWEDGADQAELAYFESQMTTPQPKDDLTGLYLMGGM